MHILNLRILKRLLKGTGIIALVLTLAIGVTGVWLYNQAQQSNVGNLKFDNPIAIPPLLEPRTDDEGRKVFDLTITAGKAELIPGKRTDTWGINGPYLSPTLRASQGDEVLINVTNDVNEPTSLHWHGMHLPAAMDGGPHQMIKPGATWSPTWTINQPAATLWFHPHLHGTTAQHVYRGVAGLFLLDDPESQVLELPHSYGVDDIPVIIQDKRFNSDRSLNTESPMFSDIGILGDEILVNGTHAPYFEATTTLVRLRVLNASNARIYNLGFNGNRVYSLIGTDSGLLEAPVAMTRLQLAPGERAELVVQVAPGEDVMLRSFPPDLGMDFWAEQVNGGNDTFDILNIRTAGPLVESPPLPSDLVTIDRPEEATATTTRSFRLSGHSRINGEKMDMNRIDEAVTVGTSEIWEIRHGSGPIHSFHVHDVHFIVLDVDGQEPPAHLQGWKDTILIPRGTSVRIIARFDDYTDPEAPFMFHCHMLMHEDRGMMGQFVVVEPGE